MRKKVSKLNGFTLSQTPLAKDYFCIFRCHDIAFPPYFCFCFANKGNFAALPQLLLKLEKALGLSKHSEYNTAE